LVSHYTPRVPLGGRRLHGRILCLWLTAFYFESPPATTIGRTEGLRSRQMLQGSLGLDSSEDLLPPRFRQSDELFNIGFRVLRHIPTLYRRLFRVVKGMACIEKSVE